MGKGEEKELRRSNNECRREKDLTLPSRFDLRPTIFDLQKPSPYDATSFEFNTAPMRVLIVEDEPIIARRIERLTREILGERLTHLKAIRDLHEARAHLFSTPIDVLFLDLNLNGKDGFDLLKTSVPGPTKAATMREEVPSFMLV